MIVSIISFEPLYTNEVKGGGAEISRRVKLMEENKIKVFVHSFTKASAQNKTNKEVLYKRSRMGFILNPWLPIPVSTRRSEELIHNLKKDQPNIIIIEGFQSSADIKKIKKMKVKTILRVHNLESEYHIQMVKSVKGVKKIYHWIVALQYKWFEKRVIKYFDLILHISKEEHALSIKWMGKKSIYVPPIAKPISQSSYSFNQNSRKNILIFGDFSIGSNFIGTDWFVSKVFPILSRKYPELVLHVAGIDSHKLSKNYDKVISHGYIDDINKFFNEKKPLVIIPIAFGGGVKIKTIDTMISGIPAIYSYKSLEGIDEEIKKYAVSFKELSIDETLTVVEKYIAGDGEIDISSIALQHRVSKDFDGKLFLDIIKEGGL